MKTLMKNYLGFILGLLFGSVVATFTSYNLFYNIESLSNIELIQECLLNSIKENPNG
jgi:hypothetical protein